MLVQTVMSYAPVSFIKDLSDNLEEFIDNSKFDSEDMKLISEKIYDHETKMIVHFKPDGKGTAHICELKESLGDKFWKCAKEFEFKLEKDEYLKFLEKFLEKTRRRDNHEDK